MSKLAIAAAVAVVGVALAAAAWQYRYQLYGYLPSTDASELTNVDGRLNDRDGKPFTGRVKTQTDSGFSVYAYKQGDLDGLNVLFSEGRLREIGHWANGLQNGLFEAWTAQGVLVDHGLFKDGERHGETLQYWPETGKLKVRAVYRAGKLNGLVEQYYPSGSLEFKHLYEDHVLHGEALDFYENGELRSAVTFEHGAQSGPFKLFSEDGMPLEEGVLKDGARHGPFKIFSPQTGKVVMSGTYLMNQYDGEVTTFRPDGMKVVQTYDNGIANGWQKTYNSEGALTGEMMIRNGRPTGEFRVYDSRGNVVEEGAPEERAAAETRARTSGRPEGAPVAAAVADDPGIAIIEIR